MFYLNTIEQLFLFVEQLNQLEICLPYSILLTGIPILAVFQNLRCNSNKTSLLTTSLIIIGGFFYHDQLNMFNLTSRSRDAIESLEADKALFLSQVLRVFVRNQNSDKRT